MLGFVVTTCVLQLKLQFAGGMERLGAQSFEERLRLWNEYSIALGRDGSVIWDGGFALAVHTIPRVFKLIEVDYVHGFHPLLGSAMAQDLVGADWCADVLISTGYRMYRMPIGGFVALRFAHLIRHCKLYSRFL